MSGETIPGTVEIKADVDGVGHSASQHLLSTASCPYHWACVSFLACNY